MKCKICGRVYKSKHAFAGHLPHCGVIKKKKCPICKKEISVWVYGYHLDSHKKDTNCLACGRIVRGNKKFCDSSCAATYNNVKRARTKKKCIRCGAELRKGAEKYCSYRCHWEKRYEEWIERWLQGKESGVVAHGLDTSVRIRRWLSERCKGACEICGTKDWFGKPIPLLLDHIDGNGLNNTPSNVRMVCHNCDALLPTFAGRNRGKGRLARKRWDRKLYNQMIATK